LSAIAFSGSSFDAWSGACSGTGDCEVAIGPATTIVTATFSPDPQNANLKVNGEPFIGSTLDFTATLNLNPIQNCTWDFGDGSSESCDLPASAAYAEATHDVTHDVTIQASHVYTQAGVFIVIVTASNDAGSVVAAQQITIQTPTAEPPTQQPGGMELYFPYLNRADE
jgi:PKD repeat protein